MKKVVLVLFLVFISQQVFAEIEKHAVPCENKMCFYWWPKLPEIKGWQHDREFSLKYGANAQAPKGYSFANAETVIYARAVYKPRQPHIKNLRQLINEDLERFKGYEPMKIKKTKEVVTADGTTMESYTFFPVQKGNWEQVAYGEEGEFYLVFTISSRTESGYNASLSAYKQFVGQYSERP